MHNNNHTADHDVPRGHSPSNAPAVVSPEADETETTVSLVLSSRGRGCKKKQKSKTYRVETRTRRLNDLMFLIGWLEFFNALDFPANVFNQRPVPAYAIGLMVTGGVLILMASAVAFWDMRKSWHNLQLLRREKAHLLAELKQSESQRGDEEAVLRTLHLRAWIWVNRGELGWELIDRALMDGIGGFGGLLVGVGTLMAPAGANRRIFDASNLLSGYVGNGFVAFYGLINAGWAAYLFWQGRTRWAAVEEHLKDPQILKRARRCFWHHQVYAAVYGVTVIVASVGSLISATMWYGYVILIPCIATSVFGNILWRRRVGYNRVVFPFKPMLCQNIMDEIACVIRVQEQIREGHHGAVLTPYSRSQLLAFMYDHDMFEDLCLELTRDPSLGGTLLRGTPERIRWDESVLQAIEYDILLRAAETCLVKVGLRRTIDRERLLYELLGCYHVVERDMFKAPARSATEKSLMNRLTPGQSSLSDGTA
ncbi:hypothetical protein PG993_005655 [Apiospora rasikravindrae]|uniref:Integral membrane protein n=1 Tax=Apiospora rasikravindrae TaxID=990691 RepID=A0ABR1TG74_9PEZI